MRLWFPLLLFLTAADGECSVAPEQGCFDDAVKCSTLADGVACWSVSEEAYFESALTCFPDSDSDPLRCINALVYVEDGSLCAKCIPDRIPPQDIEVRICDPSAAP